MNYYAIGIGGTGAKCIDALLHLSAAGMMPDGDLYVLFVDPDIANGSLGRAQLTLNRYSNLRKALQVGGSDFLSTNVLSAKPDVWTPFADEAQPRLDSFFNYELLKVRDKPVADLFDALYTPQEKETTLEKGFRGHPSIGAAVMASTLKLGEGEPWATFRARIANDLGGGSGASIFLFGSIFGGTGASGFPTIARLIRDELQKIQGAKARLGGSLILPYFSFVPPTQDDQMRASSENFLLQTQVALKYYNEQDKTEIYDDVYLLGDESLTPVPFSIGAQTQCNAPHFIELMAALAAIHFFKNYPAKPQKYHLIARHAPNALEWGDLPTNDGGRTAQRKLGTLARFAVSTLCVYLPLLEDLARNGFDYRAPMYVNLVKRRGISLVGDEAQQVFPLLKEYCEIFLQWIANIQRSSEDEEMQIIDERIFAEKAGNEIRLIAPNKFLLSEFNHLILPVGTTERQTLGELWEKMCQTPVRDRNAQGMGIFFNALYRSCGVED